MIGQKVQNLNGSVFFLADLKEIVDFLALLISAPGTSAESKCPERKSTA